MLDWLFFQIGIIFFTWAFCEERSRKKYARKYRDQQLVRQGYQLDEHILTRLTGYFGEERGNLIPQNNIPGNQLIDFKVLEKFKKVTYKIFSTQGTFIASCCILKDKLITAKHVIDHICGYDSSLIGDPLHEDSGSNNKRSYKFDVIIKDCYNSQKKTVLNLSGLRQQFTSNQTDGTDQTLIIQLAQQFNKSSIKMKANYFPVTDVGYYLKNSGKNVYRTSLVNMFAILGYNSEGGIKMSTSNRFCKRAYNGGFMYCYGLSSDFGMSGSPLIDLQDQTVIGSHGGAFNQKPGCIVKDPAIVAQYNSHAWNYGFPCKEVAAVQATQSDQQQEEIEPPVNTVAEKVQSQVVEKQKDI